MSLEQLKHDLALVFDDNTKTVIYKNYLDCTILFLIFLSTLEVFLSTFPGVVEKYGRVLDFVDIFTTIFFTIEVALRIWTIDLVDEKYQGFWGRVRYCFSFYGLIDIVSTYSYYVNMITPLPVSTLKVLRVARLFRIFRFMKSSRLLSAAIENKSKELLVSLQFLIIVTVILSFVLFFAEHESQPEVYSNGCVPMLWAFMQYIGDPGGLGDYPPVTHIGKIIASVIGILGIAIFAVPAGLIGSGFTDEIENDRHNEKLKKDLQSMRYAFKQKQCRFTKFIRVPNHVSVTDLQAEYHLDIDDVMAVVEANPTRFRLRNLAKARPVEERPEDKLVVETFPFNRSYGCFIDRGSKVTIVAPSNSSETAIGPFSYYLAKIGGFNYISKEIDANPNYTTSYYTVKDQHANSQLEDFLGDLKSLNRGEDNWMIFFISSCGGEEPLYPTQFHYVCCCKKGDENIEGEDASILDRDLFRKAYASISETLEKEYGYTSDCQRYHNTPNAKTKIETIAGGGSTCNAFTLRINWSVTCWDMRHIAVAKTLADKFNELFEPGVEKKIPEDLTKRVKEADYGYDFYKD
ncbi:MAG: ion transporter [Paludibacteraceae bacterium]|nr:ion transporter [Paludibacteraceae bacterium]